MRNVVVMNKGLVFKLCLEYVKVMTVRQELLFLDDDLYCPEAKDALDLRLVELEGLLLGELL